MIVPQSAIDHTRDPIRTSVRVPPGDYVNNSADYDKWYESIRLD